MPVPGGRAPHWVRAAAALAGPGGHRPSCPALRAAASDTCVRTASSGLPLNAVSFIHFHTALRSASV